MLMPDTHDLVVVGVRFVADAIVEVRLRAGNGGSLPTWRPGAHIEVHLEPQLARQYSLCGNPDVADEWQLAVMLEPRSRGGSLAVHRLQPGDEVRASAPRNHFEFSMERPRQVFVAGGIGVTPIIPMIAEAAAKSANWAMLYGGRRRSSMAYARELVQRYGEDRVRVLPQDEFGLLPLADWIGEPRDDTVVYACGPEPLLLATETLMAAWPSGALRMERFAPSVRVDATDDAAFEVELVRSGLNLTVPFDRSILDVLEDAEVDFDYSCRDGTCGTCETRLIAGEPDHRDSVLSQEEQARGDVIMVCVSRARSSRLVLDL